MLRVVDIETREVTSVGSTGRIRFGSVSLGSTTMRSEENEGVGRSFDVTGSGLASVRFLGFDVLGGFRGSSNGGRFRRGLRRGRVRRGERRLRESGVGKEREIE